MLLLVATGINLCAAEDDVMAEPVAKSSGKEIAVSKRYSYPAPNFKNGSRLLFQGDSITAWAGIGIRSRKTATTTSDTAICFFSPLVSALKCLMPN